MNPDEIPERPSRLQPTRRALNNDELATLRQAAPSGKWPRVDRGCDFPQAVAVWLEVGGTPEAEVECSESRDWRLLHEACARNGLDAIKALVAAGANIERDADGRFPVQILEDNNLLGYPACFDDDPAEAYRIDEEDRVVFKQEAFACLTWLQTQGSRDVTALIFAAQRGDEAEVQQLLDQGFPAHTQRRTTGSALSEATRTGHDTLCQRLLAHGARPTLWLISKVIDRNLPTSLSAQQDPRVTDWEPLRQEPTDDDHPLLRSLIEHWAPANERWGAADTEAVSCLLNCVGTLSPEIKALLLKRGFDPFIDSPAGAIPPCFALCDDRRRQIESWMENYPIDLHKPFACGASLMHWALLTGWRAIWELVQPWEIDLQPALGRVILSIERDGSIAQATLLLEQPREWQAATPAKRQAMPEKRLRIPLLHLAAVGGHLGTIIELQCAGAGGATSTVTVIAKHSDGASVDYPLSAQQLAAAQGHTLVARWLGQQTDDAAGLPAIKSFLHDATADLLTGLAGVAPNAAPPNSFKEATFRRLRAQITELEAAAHWLCEAYNLETPPLNILKQAEQKSSEEFDDGMAVYSRANDPLSLVSFAAFLAEAAKPGSTYDRGKFLASVGSGLRALQDWFLGAKER